MPDSTSMAMMLPDFLAFGNVAKGRLNPALSVVCLSDHRFLLSVILHAFHYGHFDCFSGFVVTLRAKLRSVL